MPTPTNRPGRKPPDEVLWLVATISLVLPFAGGLLGFIGLARLLRGYADGGWWLGSGAALLVLDLLSDIWLHRVSREGCDEPTLNCPGNKLIGRTAILDQPIHAGRGRARFNGGWWMVEGPDLPAGTRVQVTACRGSVLTVEPVAP